MKNGCLIKKLVMGLLGTVLLPSLLQAWIPPKNIFRGLAAEDLKEGANLTKGAERDLRVTREGMRTRLEVTDLSGKVNQLIQESAVKESLQTPLKELPKPNLSDSRKFYSLNNTAAQNSVDVLVEKVPAATQSENEIKNLLDGTRLCEETREQIFRQAQEQKSSVSEVTQMISDAEMEYSQELSRLFDKYKIGDGFIDFLIAREKYKLSIWQVEDLINSVKEQNLASEQIVAQAEEMFGKSGNSADSYAGPNGTVESPAPGGKSKTRTVLSLGAKYQAEFERNIWRILRDHVPVKKFNLVKFPQTLEEQSEFVQDFVSGYPKAQERQTLGELFSQTSSLDITAQAQVAWAAHEGRKVKLSDFFHRNERNVAFGDLFRNNHDVDVAEMVNLIETEESLLRYRLQEEYGVDYRVMETVDWVARKYRFTFQQVEELIRSIDWRAETIRNQEAWQLRDAVYQKAAEINAAAESLDNISKELGSLALLREGINAHRSAQVRDIIIMGQLNEQQSKEIFSNVIRAIGSWDPAGLSINSLWLLLKEKERQGIRLSAEEVVTLAKKILSD